MRKFLLLFAMGCGLITAGCPLFIAGAGAGAGVYAYVNGELKRSFPASFERTNQAALDALEDLKITITDKASDGFKTKLSAKRTDGLPVTVKITEVDRGVSEVSVRCGAVGIWDRKASELIHASIAKRLQ